jgi:hypothetical protein
MKKMPKKKKCSDITMKAILNGVQDFLNSHNGEVLFFFQFLNVSGGKLGDDAFGAYGDKKGLIAMMDIMRKAIMKQGGNFTNIASAEKKDFRDVPIDNEADGEIVNSMKIGNA